MSNLELESDAYGLVAENTSIFQEKADGSWAKTRAYQDICLDILLNSFDIFLITCIHDGFELYRCFIEMEIYMTFLHYLSIFFSLQNEKR